MRAMACLLAVCGLSSTAWAQAIHFQDACQKGDRVTVAAVGDLLFHSALQKIALSRGSDFQHFWQPVLPVLTRADVVYGNLEGPAARGVAVGGRAVPDPGKVVDGRVYGAHVPILVFNIHPSAVADVKAGGFHVVSTANNHAADRGSLGVDRTIEALEEAGLPFTGTRKRDETGRRWSTVTHTKGINIAWLACTYSLNGAANPNGQVLGCYSQKQDVLDEVKKLAEDPSVDAVILTPHWGVEGSHVPNLQDRKFAREVIDAGATAIVGTHPHVLQPWEKYKAPDGREALIIYSTGNFISNQRKPPERSGIIALLELVKPEGAKAHLAAAGFIPTFVEITSNYRVVENTGGVNGAGLKETMRILPANRVLSGSMDKLPKECRAEN